MDNYLIWAIIGGTVAIVLVSLCYMGFFSYNRKMDLKYRKVTCTAEEMGEMVLAYILYVH